MTEVINASSNISSLLLMKHNDLLLKSQQSHSKAIEEIANKMDIEFVNFNEFSDIHEFRSDLYGDNVRKATWKKNSRPVILRSVPGYSIEDHHKKLTEEIRRSKSNMNCENIIQLLGVTEDSSEKNAVLVIQHPKDGTLKEYLSQHKDLDWPKKFNLAKDIAYGIRHLHKAGIAHGDLHELNVFIEDGKALIRDPRLFGFDDDETSSSSTLNSDVLSTIPFVDPQVMGDMKHKPDKRSDIYSFGVLMWELSSCKSPFHDTPFGNGNQVLLTMAIMVRKTREQPVPNTPEEYVQLYQQCWDHEPDMRPSIEQVCEQIEGFLYDEPVITGKSLSNSIVIADIRASSEESRKSHDNLHPPSLSSSQLQSSHSQNDNEKPLSLVPPEPKYQDANLSEPISPKTLAKINKEIEKSKGIKKFKSKISKIFKKMSCFS
ncbi:kinase-like protein [Rhizophagus irregularis]|uniref:Kinase-like protein n=4 Tax=Rhizophagus irregularis TaxID=588596 RepID=A0A2I1EV64_9GLOM|nr:Bck1p [Rhizophagus irregularis DAOM 197198w]PKC01002.1 kinase-like protein [Rhizophagus irregularis]GBC39766.1 kinase-like domain-containing protein [Rhizophagus irregularis DAOM 181602=DAOM 197198]PKC63388.1 kinase-like protein [Rhizophagus irregularis]PKK65285.1 kinase-like protein [Rhizophagus irregularis]